MELLSSEPPASQERINLTVPTHEQGAEYLIEDFDHQQADERSIPANSRALAEPWLGPLASLCSLLHT